MIQEMFKDPFYITLIASIHNSMILVPTLKAYYTIRFILDKCYKRTKETDDLLCQPPFLITHNNTIASRCDNFVLLKYPYDFPLCKRSADTRRTKGGSY
jgi:hypothetical protein